jgi:hypothetical protein
MMSPAQRITIPGWRDLVRSVAESALLASAIGSGIVLIAEALLGVEESTDHPSEDAAVEASTLLGVPLDASADEVRAALRRELSVGRVHPDQGGDGVAAARLIASKNLLIERKRI